MEHAGQPQPGATENGGSRRAALGILFFFSGATALVYELAWFRQFNVFFGSAATASAAILVAFFTGLGIGSVLLGRKAGRIANPWLAYAFLELVIAAGALAAGPLMEFYSAIAARQTDPTSALIIKGLFGFVSIAAPTVAMGGTLPVLAQLVDARKEAPGQRVGWLYVVNTCGAAVGALAFPFVLLPRLGIFGTTLACAAANGLVALAAWRLGRGWTVGASEPAVRTRPTRAEPIRSAVPLGFVSGLGTFALQVLWNRAFAQVHENSLTTFAVIAAIFIAAIALGGEAARWTIKMGWRTDRALARAWGIGAMMVLLWPELFLKVTNGLEFLPANAGEGRLAMLALGTILPPVLLLAMAMPLLLQDSISASGRPTGAETGRLLGANLGGSIAGALLAGFVLPLIAGMWKSMALIGALYLGAAALVRWRTWQPRAAALAGVALLALLLGAKERPRARVEAQAGERLVAQREGAHGIVAVTERERSRRLKLNNHYVLGGTSATGDERLQAHLPLLVHPAPRNVAFLGFGTGITAGGSAFHPGVQAVGVELVPEVARFAREFFGAANMEFGANGVSRLVVADAREFLRRTTQKFDVIVGDLVVPWRPGEASLYTREHFAAAKAALAEGGLLCVWLPLFQVNEARFKIVLNTFLAEFDEAMIWRGDFSPDETAMALMAFHKGALSQAGAEARLRSMRPDPLNPQLKHPPAFWMHFSGILKRASAGLEERRINTEDLPWLEVRVPNPARYFAGPGYNVWEEQVRAASRERIAALLSGEAINGWQAGSLMPQFAATVASGRRAEAGALQERIRAFLGEEAFAAVFGK